LGTGFLTGTITAETTFDPETDLRASFPRFTKGAMQANMPLIKMLNALALKKGISTVQLALAWLLSKNRLIVPIPGMYDCDIFSLLGVRYVFRLNQKF